MYENLYKQKFSVRVTGQFESQIKYKCTLIIIQYSKEKI